MWSVFSQAVYRFFFTFTEPLNKTEVDQPAPLDVRREHLLQELKRIDEAIAKRRKFLKEL